MEEKINVDKREKQRVEELLHPLAIYSYTMSHSKNLLLIVWINLNRAGFNYPLDNEISFKYFLPQKIIF